MNAPMKNDVDVHPEAVHPIVPRLSCRGLWKIYGEHPLRFLEEHGGAPAAEDFAAKGYVGAVRDATLEVGEGEVFVIMGLSGSGKSTLLRCLARLIEPTAGSVLLGGRDLLSLPPAELIQVRRHEMGMVFQNFALLPHLTVLGNVAFPLEVQGVARAARETRARELIDMVGLGGREGFYPRELSGGQQQRVGIARSLAVNPPVWFLDEPFSALDPLIRREMQAELLRLQEVLRKTVVFITHDFDEAIRLADRIAIMKDGVIIQVGTPEDLVLHPANDYVQAFTRDVPRAKVVPAAHVMVPPSAPTYARSVPADACVAAFAAALIEGARPWGVTSADGGVIGEVRPEAVVRVLAGLDVAPA